MNTKTTLSLSHIIPISLFLLTFFIFVSADAQEPATTTTEARPESVGTRTESPETILTQEQASTSASMPKQQTIRSERQAALQEIRQKRVFNLSANISNRMEAAITRLYDIVARFEQRIAKLKVTGVDTAATETKIREASRALAEARTTLHNIDTLVYDATTSTEPQNNWVGVRTTYQEAGQYIRTSHQALREAIALLKIATSNTNLTRSAAVIGATSTASTTE